MFKRAFFPFFFLDFLENLTFWGFISKKNQDTQEIKTLKNSQVTKEKSRVIKLNLILKATIKIPEYIINMLNVLL